VDHDTPLAGRTIERVVSRGKHLLIEMSGNLILHTHMRMNGSWHIYRAGERWHAPARDMRIVLGTDPYVAVAFNVPVAEFLSVEQRARHRELQALGPDLTDPSFDRNEVWRRLGEVGNSTLQDALLNQRVLSGIGNVLKSEVLFVARVDPFMRTGDLGRGEFDKLMDVALKLMKMNIGASGGMSAVPGRRTTGSLDPRAKLFVYGRSGKACRVCGTAIEARKTGVDARLTYWCPRCQASRSGAASSMTPRHGSGR
jgi:endonuclease VIII